LRGQSVSTDGAKVVKPFRKLTLPGLPSPSLKNKYKVQWKPIFSYLEEDGAYEVPRSTQQMADGEIKRIYGQCMTFLKDNVSYCFQSRRSAPTYWGFGTWWLKTRRSTILKKGTEVDKAKVALATNRNRARRPSTRLGRQMATNPLYRYRQRQRVDRLIRNNDQPLQENNLQETAQDDGDAFGNAFENVALSEAAHARGQEIEQEVNAELQVEIQEQRANRNRVGDAVGHDGDVLFVRATDGEAPIPGTEAHRIWLTIHVDSLPT
jgi:hypothetical protein